MCVCGLLLLTRARASAVVLGVWVVASLISFLPIHLKLWVSHDEEAHQCLADEYCCDFNTNAAYAVSSSIVSFYLPLAMMIFLYSRVFQEAQKQLEKIRGRELHLHNLHYTTQLPHADGSLATNEPRGGTDMAEQAGEDGQDMQNIEGTDTRESRAKTQRHKDRKAPATKRLKFSLKEHKAVKTLGIIMGTFTLCWLPFFILNILMNLLDLGDITLLFRLLNWLGYSNSAFNPLIYCRSPDFRHAFQEILCLRDRRGGRRRGWGGCVDRDCTLKPPCWPHEDLGGVRRFRAQLNSWWRSSRESSVQGSSLTLDPPASSGQVGGEADGALGSTTNCQANGRHEDNLTSIT